MATATATAYCDATSLTTFNAWAQWIYDQFIAFGWTQTADTGQQTWPATGSVPSSAVYNVFVSADRLSTAYPIYVKVEMWASSDVPQIAITVGTGGTDGAGNMNSPHTTRTEFNPYTNDTTNQQNLYASGDAGSIRFLLWTPSGFSGYPETYETTWIVIGRSYNADGNQTGDSVLTWFGAYSNKAYQVVYNATIGGTNTQDTSGYFLAALPYAGTSAAMGGTVLVSPVFQNIGGFTNPTPDFLVGKGADFPSDSVAACTVYSTSHNYMPSTFQSQLINGITTSMLIRYE
jgi:hypothetical protein